VEASNLCSRTLIFGSFSFIVFLSKKFPPLFCFFFCLVFYCIFLIFYLLFHPWFALIFLAHVVSSLAYPNLVGTKMLGCCCQGLICQVMSLQKKMSCNVLKSLFRDRMDSKDTNFSVFNLLAIPFLAIHPHFRCIPFRIITANSYWLSQITTLTTDSTEQCAIRNKQSEFNRFFAYVNQPKFENPSIGYLLFDNHNRY
jgi:hypothetical protein